MRLFVAIGLPKSLRRSLAQLATSRHLEAPRAKWVTEDRLHLTLAFLGEKAEGELEPISAVLASAAERHRAFSLTISGPGTFPPGGKARVLWMGIENSRELEALQADIAAALSKATSFASERRPFHPHLTLARCRPPWPGAAAQRWRSGPARCVGEVFTVTYIDLMQSVLSPAGPAYSRVQRYALRDRQ